MILERFNNFLSDEDVNIVIEKTFNSSKWGFKGSSVDPKENSKNFIFWFLNLNDETFFTDYLFNLIKLKTHKNFKLLTVYANGQTYGLDGTFHTDGTESNKYTLLYYSNPVWNYEWGGGTVFWDEESKNAHVEVFNPNKAVLFRSNVHHYGQAPNRHTNQLRVTVAFKLEETHEA